MGQDESERRLQEIEAREARTRWGNGADGVIDAKDIHGISGSPPYGVHHHDRFTFADGAIAVLTYPSKMSREDFEDFEDWLRIELRKITRMAGCSGSDSGAAPPRPIGGAHDRPLPP